MAAGRKLQAEIDKLFKKVEEGLEEFNNIWDGVHSASQPNQREKMETELKAQIKKLQRDREQIKTWLGDKNIKDKVSLSDARRKIEEQMERFKEFERDAKTKTYSKEGLMKTDKVDPEEEERRRHRTWIQDSVNKLQVQIDELDADREAQSGGKKSKAKQDEAAVAHLKFVQETHRWHINKLEQLLRKLDNDEVNLEELDDLKDSVDFYVDDNSRDPADFQEFDTIYEEFNLEEVEDYLTKDSGKEKEKEEAEKDEPAEKEEEKKKEEAKQEKPAKETKTVLPKAAPTVRAKPSPAKAAEPPSRKVSSVSEDTHESSGPAKPWPPMVSVWQNPPPAPSPPEKDAKAPPAVSPGPPPKPGSTGARPAPSLPPPMQPAPDRPPPPGQAPVLNTPPNQPPPKPAPQMQPPTQAPPQPPLPSPPVGSPPRPAGNAAAAVTGGSAPPMPAPPPMPPPSPQDGGAAATAAGAGGGGEPPSTAPPPPPPPLLPPPPPAAAPAASAAKAAPASKQPPVQASGSGPLNDRDPPHLPPPASATAGAAAGPRQAPKAPPPPSEAPPPPSEMPPPPPESSAAATGSSGDAVSGFGQREAQSAVPFESGGLVPSLRPSQASSSPAPAAGDDACGPLSPRRLQDLQLLSASHRHLPAPSDSRRNRKYVPRNPYVHVDATGNAAYHMQPTRNYEDPAMFEKYDLDTLFFIFYYQQGSYQQHLAAKELKKLSWRYHTKYLTWFQRHEEPRHTAAEYERGAYVYFDHDSGWCQRIKSDFTFEYQFLEDEPM
eukprot:TRINITY_DN48350_c0_g1_i1.p1 TRINITY_DN48350_c0_g1~~TRINITY_DN48350_c0_g1_i1.p1  ORF type:complete len:774 (-),score=220.35 TRINITY_DN48350_c0_g1_i1:67-2388(-)